MPSQIRCNQFHPLMWWIWASALAFVVLFSNDKLVSSGAILATVLMVRLFPSDSYWYSTFRWALRLACIAFTIRMLIGFVIGVPMPGKTLFKLPEISLPEFLVGVRLGGPVTTSRLDSALQEALLLSALILIFAAANALSNPHSILRVLPRRFYGVGVSAVIASSVAPQTAQSIARVRRAKRLRGQHVSGVKSWRSTALPVLEDSLERSIDLAASLESRGYGYFPKPTRYRPINWQSKDFFAISGVIYLIVALFVTPQVPILSFAAAVFLLSLTPAVSR